MVMIMKNSVDNNLPPSTLYFFYRMILIRWVTTVTSRHGALAFALLRNRCDLRDRPRLIKALIGAQSEFVTDTGAENVYVSSINFFGFILGCVNGTNHERSIQ